MISTSAIQTIIRRLAMPKNRPPVDLSGCLWVVLFVLAMPVLFFLVKWIAIVFFGTAGHGILWGILPH